MTILKKTIITFINFLFFTAVLPLIILYRLQTIFDKKHIAFQTYSQLMSLIPGRIGNRLRYAFYKLSLKSLGKGVTICFGVTFAYPDIVIGDRVYIGPFCHLAMCHIGNDTLIATGIYILSGLEQHGISDITRPISEQKGKLKTVRIGTGCWIGNKALVANHVGQGSVIGSAAVVVKQIPEYSIAVGNPAKVIKSRKDISNHDAVQKAKQLIRDSSVGYNQKVV